MDMLSCDSFQIELASIMDELTKTSIVAISRLVNKNYAILSLEVSRSQTENQALRKKLELMENKLREVRGSQEQFQDSSINISLELQACNDRQDERIMGKCLGSTQSSCGEHAEVDDEGNTMMPVIVKHEGVDIDQGWSYSLPLSDRNLQHSEKNPFQEGLEICVNNNRRASIADHVQSVASELQQQSPAPPAASEEWVSPGSSADLGKNEASIKTEPENVPLWSSPTSHECISEQGQDICRHCGKGFRYKGYLKIHQRVHTQERPFVCTQCGKGFSQISNLRTHKITHTREKAHNCERCNKTFCHLQGLKLHQRTHDGNKPFRCKICGHTFQNKVDLIKHANAHSKGKQFRCALCDKAFTAKSSLKTHQSVHTGERPFSCEQCGKTFAHYWNLKTHKRVHTGEKPFSCVHCGKRFTQKHVLEKHLRIHSQGHKMRKGRTEREDSSHKV